MKLEFRLLVIDDEPDGVREAVTVLREHLVSKGLTLDRQDAADRSRAGLRTLARQEGREYDLVMIDYKLGEASELNGAEAAYELRRELRYTDMVFYSGVPTQTLRQELSDASVEGVFTATRGELADALTGLADTVIGKVVDVDHMRGVAMAEVAEMEVMIEDALGAAFEVLGSRLEGAAARTRRRLRERGVARQQRLEEALRTEGLGSILGRSGLADLSQKYAAFRRVGKVIDGTQNDLSVLASYQSDVIESRNLLAHAKAHVEGGLTVLRSIGAGNDEVLIDEEWMSDFRGKLRRHRAALRSVCSAIEEEVSACRDAEEAEDR